MKFPDLLIGLVILFVAASTAKALDESLIVYYSFDNTDGETVPNLSGLGLGGTINGEPKIVEGKSGSALEFDGIDDYVMAECEDVLDTLAEAVTFSAWIKTTSLVKQAIIKKNGDGNGWGPGCITLEIDPAPFPKIGFWGLIPRDCPATTNVADGEWHHVAVTYDSKSGFSDVYVDSALRSSCERLFGSIVPSKTGALCIAAADAPNSPVLHFNGVIDDVRVHNRALTQAEIEEAGEIPTALVEPENRIPSIWGAIKASHISHAAKG